MEHDTQNSYNMHPYTPFDPVLGTILMSVLAVASGAFGFLENVDISLGIIAKLVAICAGLISLLVAYQTYQINVKKQKPPNDDTSL